MTNEEMSRLREVSIAYQKALQKATRSYWMGSPDRAIEYWIEVAPPLREALSLTKTDELLVYSGPIAEDELLGSEKNILLRLAKALEYMGHCYKKGALKPGSYLTGVTSIRRYRPHYKDAGEMYEEAYEIRRTLAPESMETAFVLQNIGWAYQGQGRFDEALRKYEEAYSLLRIILPLSAQVADCLNDIGSIYVEQGHLYKALAKFEEAYSLAARAEPDSANPLFLDNIQEVYLKQGRGEDALADLARIRARNNPSLPDSETTVSDLLKDNSSDSPEETLLKYRRAYAVVQEKSPKSFLASYILNAIGDVLLKQGELTEALAYYEQAYHIDLVLAPASVEVTRDLYDMGEVFLAQKRFEEAQAQYQEAYALDCAITPMSFDIVRDLNGMGRVLQVEGNLQGAQAKYQEAYEMIQQVSPDSEVAVTTLCHLGAVYKMRGHLDEALKAFREAYWFNKVHPAIYLSNLADIYEAQGYLEEALDRYEKAYATFYKKTCPNALTLREQIFRVYQKLGREDEATAKYDQA